MATAILGISYYLPENVVTNEDLQRENRDWRMAELAEKSGIYSRHIAIEGETASDLGYRAARELLERSIVPVEEIDYLIFCTESPDHFIPPTSCVLQDRLGLGKHAGAFDYNLGCSGFVYGLQFSKSLVLGNAARNVLLITADTYSKYIHPRDRTVRTLFGDGATATLIGQSESGGEIGEFLVGTDGSGAKNLIVPSGGHAMPRSAETAQEFTDEAECTRSRDHLFMDGPAIFTFAITTIPKAVKDFLRNTELSDAQIDWYVYHQANRYMLEHLAKRSKIPTEKMIVAMETVGNTVSSSIPLAIQQGIEAHKIQPGQRLLLVGFGLGYSWGVCDVVL